MSCSFENESATARFISTCLWSRCVIVCLFQSGMTSVRSVVLCALLLLAPAAAINVLILHPVYAGSHELTLRVLGEQMVARGHSVTQIRSVSQCYSGQCYGDTQVSDTVLLQISDTVLLQISDTVLLQISDTVLLQISDTVLLQISGTVLLQISDTVLLQISDTVLLMSVLRCYSGCSGVSAASGLLGKPGTYQGVLGVGIYGAPYQKRKSLRIWLTIFREWPNFLYKIRKHRTWKCQCQVWTGFLLGKFSSKFHFLLGKFPSKFHGSKSWWTFPSGGYAHGLALHKSGQCHSIA